MDSSPLYKKKRVRKKRSYNCIGLHRNKFFSGRINKKITIGLSVSDGDGEDEE